MEKRKRINPQVRGCVGPAATANITAVIRMRMKIAMPNIPIR